MNERTLVYGLGREYQEHKDWVAANFNVTGYCDQVVERLPACGAVRREELKEHLAAFDLVLVTADPVSIVADLIEEFGVPMEKIRVLYYELAQREMPLRTFYGENAEDAVLMLLVSELGLPLNGLSYLEIGTNDPVRFNNTYNLYRLGARGLLVDPLPTVGALIRMVRPADRFLHAAVSGGGDRRTCSEDVLCQQKLSRQQSFLRTPQGVGRHHPQRGARDSRRCTWDQRGHGADGQCAGSPARRCGGRR